MKRTWPVLALVVAIGGITCGTSKPAEPQAAAVTPAPPKPSALPSSSAVAGALPGPPGKLPIRASTPGQIQCETVDCDLATEVCCVTPGEDGGKVGRCAAKPEAGDRQSPCCANGNPSYCGNEGMTVERGCDEALDCGAGQRCCAWSAWEGDLELERCDTECFSERCLAGSTCVNGNGCATEEGAAAGECPLQVKPPKCGATTCKTGELCCWDRERSTSRCAESCGEEADAVFACTAPDQCAPYDCHTYAGMSPPTYTCGGEGFYSRVLCKTIADCPEHLGALGSGPDAPKVRSCSHSRDLPAGVKGCDYQ